MGTGPLSCPLLKIITKAEHVTVVPFPCRIYLRDKGVRRASCLHECPFARAMSHADKLACPYGECCDIERSEMAPNATIEVDSMRSKIKMGCLLLSMIAMLSACGQNTETDESSTVEKNTSQSSVTENDTTTENSSESNAAAVDENAAAHEKLMAECRTYLDRANDLEDVGNVLTAEYLRGYAQAEVSSLRMCIDTILWLMGEGESLSDVIGAAPYLTWNDITGAGFGNDAPFYFEGLLYEIQGKKDEAEECYQKAAMNPEHKERDFYYLRHMSVEELYQLREQVLEMEYDISDQYTPRTALVKEPTGAEFSPAFHLALMKEYENSPTEMHQCAVNALLTNPTDPSLYSIAATTAINANKLEEAFEYVNDGLFLFKDDAELNYMAALLAASDDQKDDAKAFIARAKEKADEELMAKIQALSEQIGE